MIKTKKIKTTSEQAVSITCDKCKKTFDVNKSDDQMEIQEFHHVGFVGGFSSVFGDGIGVKCDICQRCLKEMIGDIVRYTND
jgi:hypothetical protein